MNLCWVNEHPARVVEVQPDGLVRVLLLGETRTIVLPKAEVWASEGGRERKAA